MWAGDEVGADNRKIRPDMEPELQMDEIIPTLPSALASDTLWKEKLKRVTKSSARWHHES